MSYIHETMRSMIAYMVQKQRREEICICFPEESLPKPGLRESRGVQYYITWYESLTDGISFCFILKTCNIYNDKKENKL
ncbi:unnamed protein product [Wuchereria bancrofti]|uniref:Uncharacterized protein n=2 Tax=Wuchereria bancrofti TaxID=6293 RepID=A0A3P7EW21_WUCBA|nr:unnamed protein product [Wuchereria bancrofti]